MSERELVDGILNLLVGNTSGIDQGKKQMGIKRKGISSPNGCKLVLADRGWTNGSHYKPQAYSVGGRGGPSVEDGLPLWGISGMVVLIP